MSEALRKKLKRWIANKAEQCRAVAPLYSYALDRKLTVIERIRIRFHLMTCNACRDYVENLGFMRAMFRAEADTPMDTSTGAGLPSEARERIKRALKSES
jgi:predicted anti-sigma-YlaC factor YlaD